MADNLIEAFRRCEELSKRISPEALVEVMETHERGDDVDRRVFEDAVNLLIYRDALYAVKAGMSRKDFVSWCELAYELQGYLHADSDDRQEVLKRVQALRNGIMHGHPPAGSPRG